MLAVASTRSRPAPPRRLRTAITTLLLMAGLASVACGGDSNNNTNRIASTSTTVGDTTVVRTTGVIPDGGTHTLTERWRVGDADGLDTTISFGGINGFSVNSEGTVAVFDFTGPTLRTYDANGAYVRTIGRKGAGPGEYTQNNGMVYLADGRLAFWDPATARITLYNVDGSVHSEWRPPVTGMWMFDALRVISTHALAVNSTLSQTTPGNEPPPRGPRPSAYFLYDETGAITDTLLVPQPTEQPATITAETEGMSLSYGVKFSASALDALLPNGQLAVAFGRDYAIRFSHGARPMRIERETAIVSTTDGERSNWRDIVEYQIQRSMPEWRWDGPSLPSVKPAIRALTAATDNRLWVQVSAPGEMIPESERIVAPTPAVAGGPPASPVVMWREPTWYDVYEPDGTFFARIVMPPNSTLLGARGDRAWGVVTDTDDVPFLVQWRITPAVQRP